MLAIRPVSARIECVGDAGDQYLSRVSNIAHVLEHT